MLQLFTTLFFLIVQVFTAVALVVIRYHFRIFSLPGDSRARLIVNIFTLGTLLAMAGAALVLITIL